MLESTFEVVFGKELLSSTGLVWSDEIVMLCSGTLKVFHQSKSGRQGQLSVDVGKGHKNGEN